MQVWFEPVMVWEVRGADMQLSPVHTAGTGSVDSEKGIGLRFPRLLRIRDDKKPPDVTNSEQIVEMYQGQAIFAGTNFEDDDYY